MQNPELSRRQMIVGSGLLAGTSGLMNAKPGLKANPASAMPPKTNPIPLTFSTYGLPTYPLNEAIDAIGEIGYDGIEICVAAKSLTATEKLSSFQRIEARNRLKDRGLIVGSLMSHLQPLGSKEQHSLDSKRLKQDCILARELSPDDPPVIQTILGGRSWVDSRQKCVDRIADWVATAKKHEVVIAVKPHRGHAMSRPSEAAWLIAQLDQPKSLRMWYDYSHFIFRDIPMKQSVEKSFPILAGVAVKDAIKKDGKVQFLLPGASGLMDYKLLYQLLRKGNFTGPVCVEVSSHVWKRADYDATVAMQTSHDILSSAMTRSSSFKPE
jgi:sugar phosphate isomerase/epimerase